MRENVATQIVSRATCLHCGQSLSRNRIESDFCCVGCHTVYTLIHDENLDRFYTLKPKTLLPLINYFTRKTDWQWIQNLKGLDMGKVSFKIEGLQCAACIWLLSTMAKKMGPSQVMINPSNGRMDMQFDTQKFDFTAFLKKVELLGYAARALDDEKSEPSRDLLIRLGICMAIAMNTMFFSFSIYAGLTNPADPIYRVFNSLNFYLSFLSVAVGGSYFFGKAITALKNGVVHFDVPIAIGILATFVGSSVAYMQGNHAVSYFDTINIFIALMLLGRYVQVRFLERNQKGLSKVDPFHDFTVTVAGENLSEKKFSEIKKDDPLLIQPGALFPVDCVLESVESVECSLASITGEPMPQIFKKGDVICAGAQLVSGFAVKAMACDDYNKKALDRYVPQNEDGLTPYLWRWFTRWYVVVVLCVAFSGLAYWLINDASRALNVFVSVMIVTCPCALGVAIPLARHMANRELILNGVFAKNPEFIDKLEKIKNIFCDKTGTLTLGVLQLTNPQQLDLLNASDKTVLFNMVCRSRHPASLALYRELIAQQLPSLELVVNEKAGVGLLASYNEKSYFLGKGDLPGVYFKRDDVMLAHISYSEEVLSDVQQVLKDLTGEGINFYLLSGDKAENVKALAVKTGFLSNNVFSNLVPGEKAAFVKKMGEEASLMIGDGLNDGLAMQEATLSGGPVWEKWGIARNADFFFVSNTLGWLTHAYALSKKLKKVLRNNLTFTVLYNIGAVSISLLGLANPLVCAIIMPASSVIVLAYTAYAMRSVNS
ncbi:heavy metal translocating P-type ATPase metal-binding domain-containing protein [bacterium]|nr:heavy metal translocating P-type ATPase metal-binding domain-containing protein [bacterium]